MNKNENLLPSTALHFGDRFSYRGEVGTFLEWRGYARSNTYGVYRAAVVQNGDGAEVLWSLNQAGSVKV